MKHFEYPSRWPLHMLTAPLIFGMIIPTVILDICLEIYHRICFPLYRIPYVNRSYHIIVDRHKLAYLDFPMKLFCAYCGYVNGVYSYAVAIAGETEKFWCAIMHSRGMPSEHQKEFLPYGDRAAYRKYVADARKRSGSNRNAKLESYIFLAVLAIALVLWLVLR